MLNQKAIKKARGALVVYLRTSLTEKMDQIQALLGQIEELESEEKPIVEQAEKFLSEGNKLWNMTALRELSSRTDAIKIFDQTLAKIAATKDAAGTIEVLQLSFADTDQYKRLIPITAQGDSEIPIENIVGQPRLLYDVLKEAELNPLFIRRGTLESCLLQISW
jgi:hypothetical protein